MVNTKEIFKNIYEKQIKKEEDVKGEIKRVFCHNETLVIVFLDNRWAYYEAGENVLGGASIILEEDPPDEYVLHWAGLIENVNNKK